MNGLWHNFLCAVALISCVVPSALSWAETSIDNDNVSFSLEDIQNSYWNHLKIPDHGRLDNLYLYAPDLKVSVVAPDDAYCKVTAGAVEGDGNFYLVVERDGKILSTIPMGGGSFFKAGPFNGIEHFIVPGGADSYVRTNEYSGCTGNLIVGLYSVDEGIIRQTKFIMKDGKTEDSMMNLRSTSDGKGLVSVYNNYVGRGGDGTTNYHTFRRSTDPNDHDLHETLACVERPDSREHCSD